MTSSPGATSDWRDRYSAYSWWGVCRGVGGFGSGLREQHAHTHTKSINNSNNTHLGGPHCDQRHLPHGTDRRGKRAESKRVYKRMHASTQSQPHPHPHKKHQRTNGHLPHSVHPPAHTKPATPTHPHAHTPPHKKHKRTCEAPTVTATSLMASTPRPRCLL